jgi:hypothetical protein
VQAPPVLKLGSAAGSAVHTERETRPRPVAPGPCTPLGRCWPPCRQGGRAAVAGLKGDEPVLYAQRLAAEPEVATVLVQVAETPAASSRQSQD